MTFNFINCNPKYEAELLCCHFFPKDDGVLTIEKTPLSYTVSINFNGKTQTETEPFEWSVDATVLKRNESTAIKRAFFRAASKLKNVSVPWGTLMGIRPLKPVERHLKQDGEEKTLELLRDFYYLSPSKADIAIKTAKETLKTEKEKRENGVSIYVGIPFCPTRCAYCSFVSHSISNAKGLLPVYLEKLKEEILKKGEILKEKGLSPETLYIGGGTPAVLSADEISSLFETLNTAFNLDNFKEITFEAGRPDCITEEKARALASVSTNIRISVNPQSLNDEVLKRIGRNHTAKDFFNALETVRNKGLNRINSDVIAGLNGESLESFKNTLLTLINENIPSLTVHTLCKKRAADNESYENPEVCEMVDFSADVLAESGYLPYYLYRQRNISSNLENIGWAKDNGKCLYNIYMMEEVQTVIACGAGSVSKILKDGRVLREGNCKFPHEYLKRPLNFDKSLL